MQNLQLFAWQANARGSDVHLNANPTQGELLHQEYREKKEKLRDSTKIGILAKYGGEEYLAVPPAELRQGQTEEYVEYSRLGQVIKGKERTKTRSKYHEDGMSVQNLVCFYFYTYKISQSLSTIIRLFGAHGMMLRTEHGVTLAVVLRSTSRIAWEK
jgi:hypothetical protein